MGACVARIVASAVKAQTRPGSPELGGATRARNVFLAVARCRRPRLPLRYGSTQLKRDHRSAAIASLEKLGPKRPDYQNNRLRIAHLRSCNPNKVWRGGGKGQRSKTSIGNTSMNRAKANWHQLRQLWPLAVAVLAACGGASESTEETATTDDETVATTPGTESAQARRRGSWINCAVEGATCELPGTRVVRYGANGAHYYKTVAGSIACNNRTWGDPLVGVFKKCDYLASASTSAPVPASPPNPAPPPAPAPAPAPAPTPTPAPPVTARATLSWSPSSSPQVAGYRVYYGTASRAYLQTYGNGVDVGAATTFVVAGLPSGKMHYFSVTSIDTSGNESPFSNEASKLVQ
jgi:hypothetical protein